MNNSMIWILIICDVIVIIAMAATPFLTRKTELFGVSLPSSEINRPELSAMRRSYLLITLVFGAVLLILNVVLFRIITNESTLVGAFVALIFGYIIVEFLVYLAWHRKMKAFKNTQPWRTHGNARAAAPDIKSVIESNIEPDTESGAEPVLVVDTAPPSRDVIHPAWLLIYAVVAIITLLVLWQVWPTLPEQIPIHANAAGVIDGWVDKTPGAVGLMLFGQWIIIAVFIFVYILIRISKRQIDAAAPAASREQGRRFRLLMSGCMVFGGAALALVTGLLPIMMAASTDGKMSMTLPLILIFAIIAVMLVLMFLVGQGGSRLKVKSDDPRTQKRQAGTDDDRYWKLGVFYFNPADPAVIVEKRFGVGWTNNFARPVSWLMIGGLIAVIVVTLVIAFAL